MILATTNKTIFNDIEILAKYIDVSELKEQATIIIKRKALPVWLELDVDLATIIKLVPRYNINLNVEIEPKLLHWCQLQGLVLLQVAE